MRLATYSPTPVPTQLSMNPVMNPAGAPAYQPIVDPTVIPMNPASFPMLADDRRPGIATRGAGPVPRRPARTARLGSAPSAGGPATASIASRRPPDGGTPPNRGTPSRRCGRPASDQ